MPEVVQGKNVSVEALIDSVYVVIGCAFSCQWTFENELIRKTDVNAGLNRKKRVRISDFRGSVQGLTTIENSATRLTVFHFLQEAIRRAENTMRFVYTDDRGNIRYVSGLFLVRSVDISADVNAFSEFDLQLEGTGGISIGTVDPVPPADCPDFDSDTWATTPGASSISGPGQLGKSFAGANVLEVDREGTQYDYTSGAPGNREFSYDGTNISFDPTNPFNDNERVFVVWSTNDFT